MELNRGLTGLLVAPGLPSRIPCLPCSAKLEQGSRKMQVTDEFKKWVRSLKVGDQVQVGVVFGKGRASGWTIEPDFMRAEVTSTGPEGVEIKSLLTGAAHAFGPSGISKSDPSLALWAEELGAPFPSKYLK